MSKLVESGLASLRVELHELQCMYASGENRTPEVKDRIGVVEYYISEMEMNLVENLREGYYD